MGHDARIKSLTVITRYAAKTGTKPPLSDGVFERLSRRNVVRIHQRAASSPGRLGLPETSGRWTNVPEGWVARSVRRSRRRTSQAMAAPATKP